MNVCYAVLVACAEFKSTYKERELTPMNSGFLDNPPVPQLLRKAVVLLQTNSGAKFELTADRSQSTI
jgi:hypothetical protein